MYIYVPLAPRRKIFLVVAWRVVASLVEAPALPPSRSEPAAGRDAHDMFGEFPNKKSWTIISCLFKMEGHL
jgi:hypothetical protein